MRLNLEMNDVQVKSLRCLGKKIGANSMKEVVNVALSLLKWAAEETASGNEIAAVNEEQSIYRVLVSPYLQHVADAASGDRVPAPAIGD